ncbi:MAG: heavy metal translocating P-type ATPase [Clostridia bacterium]|jgi:Cd2+/Zn2+-exporting ATPase|nr:heavy metal translocating P-type ATPase [Clostridia bacterium]
MTEHAEHTQHEHPETVQTGHAHEGCCEHCATKLQGITEEHEHEHKASPLIKLGTGAILYLAAIFAPLPAGLVLPLFLIAYLLIGGDILLRAIKNIRRGQIFDENFLMTIATVGAFGIGQYAEGVAVMLFYQIGETFQDHAVDRSRRSIRALMDIRPDYANLKTGEQVSTVRAEEVQAGDIILVKPGERVPLDGTIIEGTSMVDTSALTGEAVPRRVEAGDAVLSGSINTSGLLQVKVSKIFCESTVAKILELVEKAAAKKAPMENFITKFAKYYTPAVVITAAALAVLPPLLTGGSFSAWFYRALIFLVVSCPCALVISIPLSFFGGIGGASRNGILVKGGNYLEALNKVDTVVFDKTGTLTKGVFRVTALHPAGEFSPDRLLEYAALAEYYSGHPIAKSILEAYQESAAKGMNAAEIESYEEKAGYGVTAVIAGKSVLAGSLKLMQQAGIPADNVPAFTGTVVHLAVGGAYAGYLQISDEIKEDSPKAVEELKAAGVRKLYMLTGDSKVTAREVSEKLQLDDYFSELLPHEKVEQLEELYRQKERGSLVFVGDGINDAPVLARADVGVAMGLGSDAAIEAADVVLMTDEPSKLAQAIKVARKTNAIVWQNIIFSLAVKGVVLILGAGGLATIWEAVFADVGVALLAILNAMRVMRS